MVSKSILKSLEVEKNLFCCLVPGVIAQTADISTHPTFASPEAALTAATPAVTESCMSEAREPRREGVETSTMYRGADRAKAPPEKPIGVSPSPLLLLLLLLTLLLFLLK